MNKDTMEKQKVIAMIQNVYKEINKIENTYLQFDALNVSQRAIIETLFKSSLTVPQIAKQHNVSRQHIQTNVNSLLEKELVVTKQNIHHKRSHLVVLTRKGEKLFKEITGFEKRFIEDLFNELDTKDIAVTQKSLQSIFVKAQAISEAIK